MAGYLDFILPMLWILILEILHAYAPMALLLMPLKVLGRQLKRLTD